MSKRKTEQDYHDLAKRRGFKWIGKELPLTTMYSTVWECCLNHQWKTRYNDIKEGKGCPICFRNSFKSLDDYHSLAEQRGFKWVGHILPKNTSERTLWECKEGHLWQAPYYSLLSPRGCPVCARAIPRTKNDYHTLAEQKGFSWVGDLPKNTCVKTTWCCNDGHQWDTSYQSIRRDTGCPVCFHKTRGNSLRSTIEEYSELANKSGLTWLGKSLPMNVKEKTLWECSDGHQWVATYMTIYKGSRCPLCQDRVNGYLASKPQRQLCEMLNGELNYPVGNRRLDVALVGEKICIEYDSWYWHQNTTDREDIRDKEIIGKGWKVLHVRSNTLLPTMNQLKTGLDTLRGGQDLAYIVLPDWGE